MIKNLLKSLVFVIFIAIYSVSANIIETNSLIPFEEAAESANKDTIVIFDVQEVLMVAKDQILSPLYKSDFRTIKDKIIANYSQHDQERLFSTMKPKMLIRP